MTTLQTEDDIEINGRNKLFPIESLRFPLDSTMRIVFTGYFNGFSVEVRSEDEMALLYHMGCFGKGTASRSKPRTAQNDGGPVIMRKRQFLKRNYWYRKFGSGPDSLEGEALFKEVNALCTKIDHDMQEKKGVIDLVSSDEDPCDEEDHQDFTDVFPPNNKDDSLVVIVPNSDSEDDNYFNNLRPKCCMNRIKLQEKLMLTLQEAFFLLYGLGCLQIIGLDNSILNIQQCWDVFTQVERDFILKYVVYHYFRSKGYVVKPGVKFGGDYLLYRDGPGMSHASFIVVIKNNQNKNDWTSLLGHVRMATTTVKEILIAEVSKSAEDVKLPENLSVYSVRETLLSRKIPETINKDDE